MPTAILKQIKPNIFFHPVIFYVNQKQKSNDDEKDVTIDKRPDHSWRIIWAVDRYQEHRFAGS